MGVAGWQLTQILYPVKTYFKNERGRLSNMEELSLLPADLHYRKCLLSETASASV